MLTFIVIVLVLSFLFRRGGFFMGRGLFGGLFGGFPFFMGGGYRRRPPFHHGFGPMGGHGMGGPFGHGPMGGGRGHMGGGPGGRGGRF
ncbi:MAG: hypothetical protein IKH57_16295 [Clostridia bacterium]|nr:hypothetical protein [Clostridia bacterium]